MQAMNIYKHGASWWCRFTSHRGFIHKIRAARGKRNAEIFARNLALLVDAASAGAALDDPLMDWLDSIDASRLQKLQKWGLVSEKQLALKESIGDQMERWQQGLLNRGRSQSESEKRFKRAKAVSEACGWRFFRDVDGEQVLAVIDDWRRDGKVPGFKRRTAVSERTLSHYLASVKQFTRWMHKAGYVPKDPLAALSTERRRPRHGVEQSNMANRRPLSEDEQRRLVWCTEGEPEHRGLTGHVRALLYRVALQTGLRASAIQRLRCRDVLGSGWLLARSGGAKNKKTTPKPIKGGLLQKLKALASGRDEDELLFVGLPTGRYWAEMLRMDCAAAGICTDGVDFHCLRHTFGTTLARQGVHPKTLMGLMDHSDINMTMRLYTHSMPGDEMAAMDMLPDLDNLSEAECG